MKQLKFNNMKKVNIWQVLLVICVLFWVWIVSFFV